MDKKGQIAQLQPLVIALVSIGITLVIAFLIFAEVASNATVTADGNASSAIDTVTSATADLPGWLPINLCSV